MAPDGPVSSVRVMNRVSPCHASGARSTAREQPRSLEEPTLIASFPPAIRQNPYQRLLYDGLVEQGFAVERENRLKLDWLVRRRGHVRFLHFHWLQGYYSWGEGRGALALALSWLRLALFGMRLMVAHVLGYRIVWTIHQIYPHELTNRWLDGFAARLMARASHLLIAHDQATANRAESELGLRSGSVEIVRHGSYVGVYPSGRPRDVVREELGLSDRAFVFLAFGHVRAYKDVDLLLEAFAATRQTSPEAALVVAGAPLDGDAAAMIEAAAAADARIHPLLEFIPDDRVHELFAAADVAVLARGDGGTSGALILALSLGVPVIAARTPTYRDLVGDTGAGALFPVGDAGALAAELEGAVAEGHTAAWKRRATALARAGDLRWDETSAATAALFREAGS